MTADTELPEDEYTFAEYNERWDRFISPRASQGMTTVTAPGGGKQLVAVYRLDAAGFALAMEMYDALQPLRLRAYRGVGDAELQRLYATLTRILDIQLLL